MKPCPFCGGEARIQGHGYETAEYRVYCEKCGCSTKLWSESEDKAISAWNSRAKIASGPHDLMTTWVTPESCPNCMEHLAREWSYCPECGRPTGWSSNEPLTLEQLREMDGEPMYCIGRINSALTGWGIVNCRDETIVDNNGDYWDFKELGDTYFAYRRPPERSDSK